MVYFTRLIRIAVALAIAATVVTGQVSAQEVRRLALVGGMLLDGYEVPPLHHAAVIIENDRIVWAAPPRRRFHPGPR
jgi:hypothetical protein